MAGTRTVYRGSKGRFAGSSGGKAEKVRAGGFAHPGFQARFQAMRAQRPSPSRPTSSAARPKPSLNRRLAIANAQRNSGNSARIRSDLRKGVGLAAVTVGVGLASQQMMSRGNIGGAILGVGAATVTANVTGRYLGNAAGSAIVRGSKNRAAARRAAARPKIAAGTRVKR